MQHTATPSSVCISEKCQTWPGVCVASVNKAPAACSHRINKIEEKNIHKYTETIWVMTGKWSRHVSSTRLQMAPEYLRCTAANCIYKIAPQKCDAHDTDTTLMHADDDLMTQTQCCQKKKIIKIQLRISS